MNLGAILVAFIIGIAINNACAEEFDNMSDTELRQLVARLQQEVNSLKNRVAELESKIGSTSSSPLISENNGDRGIFVVDGMHFSEDGFIKIFLNKEKLHRTTTRTTVNGETTETVSTTDYSTHSRQYDSNGRIIHERWEDDNFIHDTAYSYGHKTYTITQNATAKNMDYKTTESITEYVFE